MADQRTADLAGDPPSRAEPSEAPAEFVGLLWQEPGGVPGGSEADTRTLADLRLDQVIGAVAGKSEERDLVTGLLQQQVRDPGTLRYRHEVFHDMADPALFETVKVFSGQMRAVRRHLDQLPGMRSARRRQGWFLDAAAIYCEAVRSLGARLAGQPLASRALRAFCGHLAAYLASAAFARLEADTKDRKDDLAQVSYLIRIKGLRVEVSRHDGEPDFSAEIEQAFARFRQGAVKDYRLAYRGWPGMNHVSEQILELVARLFSNEFSALEDFCAHHAGFLDPKIGQFAREIQFYLACLDHIAPLRAAGLRFCLPELTADSKDVFARDTFDLALAARLVASGTPVVVNDFELRGAERIFVVSGPNQGGKTTFARTFGQLHHLAATGCPVPGSAARLYLCDQVFTHFEREEDIADLTGRLEDDLLRIQKILLAATPRSILIMNEIFSSTSLRDARFLGRKVLEKVTELDLLCVYVTFVDELATFAGSVVSMVAEVVPDDPAQRTYQVVRKPADGLAYALAIARKHRVTYTQLQGRITA